MEKFQDVYESVLNLIEESKNPNYLAELQFTAAKANIENLNKRTYTKILLDKAVEDFNNEIKKSNVTGIVGNLDHSKEVYPSLTQSSHLITKLWMDGDLLKGKAKILNTSKGKDILTILKSGAKAGISMKGTGHIDKDGFILDDGSYKLLSCDIVNKPSFDKHVEITQANLYECANPLLAEESKEVSLVEFNFLAEKLLEDAYFETLPVANRSREGFEEFCDLHWGEYASRIEEALKKVGKTVEEPKQKIEIKIEDIPISEAHFGMAKLSGYRGTLNEFMDLKNKQDSLLFSRFQEAKRSGYSGTFDDYKKSQS